MTGLPASRVKGSVSLETESAGPEPATMTLAVDDVHCGARLRTD